MGPRTVRLLTLLSANAPQMFDELENDALLQNARDVLDVAKGSNEKMIKRAFARQSLIHHPDKATGSTEAFLLLDAAKTLLLCFYQAKSGGLDALDQLCLNIVSYDKAKAAHEKVKVAHEKAEAKAVHKDSDDSGDEQPRGHCPHKDEDEDEDEVRGVGPGGPEVEELADDFEYLNSPKKRARLVRGNEKNEEPNDAMDGIDDGEDEDENYSMNGLDGVGMNEDEDEVIKVVGGQAAYDRTVAELAAKKREAEEEQAAKDQEEERKQFEGFVRIKYSDPTDNKKKCVH